MVSFYKPIEALVVKCGVAAGTSPPCGGQARWGKPKGWGPACLNCALQRCLQHPEGKIGALAPPSSLDFGQQHLTAAGTQEDAPQTRIWHPKGGSQELLIAGKPEGRVNGSFCTSRGTQAPPRFTSLPRGGPCMLEWASTAVGSKPRRASQFRELRRRVFRSIYSVVAGLGRPSCDVR